MENLLQILEPLANEIFLITGNYPQDAIFSSKIHLTNVKYDSDEQPRLSRIPKYVLAQLKICYRLFRVAQRIDVAIFFIGGTALLLPMLSSKLLRKKSILIATGSGAAGERVVYQNTLFGKGGSIVAFIVSVSERLNYRLADKIVTYTEGSSQQLGLSKYQSKVFRRGARFVDTTLFQPTRKLTERGSLVGFFGRLSQDKGIMNFLRAIPLVLDQWSEVEFLIGGDGPLRNEIEEELKNSKCGAKVILTGWIPHEKLPHYLNDVKLLVLPSYTEGLPNIVLEAMACGTAVLSTPAGSVPDVIRDGETGFILEDNSPQCIARDAIKALNHPNLEQIADNARILVEREFTYGAAVERYRSILASL